MSTRTASPSTADSGYAAAMGRLLVLYTQVDRFIMEVCAERLAHAPDDEARMGLAKQVGDECRHVTLQQQWMREFGVDESPVIEAPLLAQLHAHFRSLDWADFLTDLYVAIEALGSHAVERIVPLADPGTRASLQVPLRDELDHVAFGLAQLRKALGRMPVQERRRRIGEMPRRIAELVERFDSFRLPVWAWFEAVGSDGEAVNESLRLRREALLGELAA